MPAFDILCDLLEANYPFNKHHDAEYLDRDSRCHSEQSLLVRNANILPAQIPVIQVTMPTTPTPTTSLIELEETLLMPGKWDYPRRVKRHRGRQRATTVSTSSESRQHAHDAKPPPRPPRRVPVSYLNTLSQPLGKCRLPTVSLSKVEGNGHEDRSGATKGPES